MNRHSFDFFLIKIELFFLISMELIFKNSSCSYIQSSISLDFTLLIIEEVVKTLVVVGKRKGMVDTFAKETLSPP